MLCPYSSKNKNLRPWCTESYPLRDKAVLFMEVTDLQATIEALGRNRIIHFEPEGEGQRPPWAVLHDPEGHNILLLQAQAIKPRA